jgi:hypothetical protein
MMDQHNHTYQIIKGFRWVPEKHWWDITVDKSVKPRFRNVLRQTSITSTNTWTLNCTSTGL